MDLHVGAECLPARQCLALYFSLFFLSIKETGNPWSSKGSRSPSSFTRKKEKIAKSTVSLDLWIISNVLYQLQEMFDPTEETAMSIIDCENLAALKCYHNQFLSIIYHRLVFLTHYAADKSSSFVGLKGHLRFESITGLR